MKRLMVLSILAAGALATTAGAEVNCKQVMKNLQTGRTPQDVADTMVISADDVKKCQEAEKSAAPGAAAGSAPAAPGGAAGSAPAAPAAGASKK
ncbi:MAG: hypothetical protein ACREQQ_14035 [Candidatus Binatia bacterium]